MSNSEKRARPGRKPLKPAERRRNRVMLNLTDEEISLLEDAAVADNPSGYAREVLIRHLRRKKR